MSQTLEVVFLGYRHRIRCVAHATYRDPLEVGRGGWAIAVRSADRDSGYPRPVRARIVCVLLDSMPQTPWGSVR